MSIFVGIIMIVLPVAVLLGGIVALANHEGINQKATSVENWLVQKHEKISLNPRWYHWALGIKPALWAWEKGIGWSEKATHEGLKKGLLVAWFISIAGLIIAVLIPLIIILVQLTLVVAMAIIAGWVILAVLRGLFDGGSSEVGSGGSYSRPTQFNSSDQYSGSQETNHVLGVGRPGTRINPKTGRIQEETIFGYMDSDERIHPDSGELQEDSIFGWKGTGKRVNQQSGELEEESLFGWNSTGKRVNPETGIIQEEGIFGWVDTDERIDPKTGKHQKNGLFGWVDT